MVLPMDRGRSVADGKLAPPSRGLDASFEWMSSSPWDTQAPVLRGAMKKNGQFGLVAAWTEGMR